ncbi:hypothetical protein NC653_031409 [Populus alba x Populus x berolinensis]|uniref:C2H2-type domain-containing protein n=1 Tax=Populus alba x Populus x berolinensis TaxID=444605 RepID=A0AAD6M172_9ROSI|nr:hypothetical protein NC653_031409 [Populus alba x Populus x berolinensis]
MDEESVDGDEGKEGVKSNTCEKCGASFKKPAYLIQHMQSHSLERPFKCLFDDCHASYRRKDHLTRHLLQHEGKLFRCQIENCNREFVYPSNLKRHVRELHDESSPSSSFGGEKQYACQEPGCGKAFRYPSKLRKHEDSHVSLDHVEAMCLEPGCMKHFSNKECLKAHIHSSHQYINCDICGTKQLKKNIKRHLRTHEPASDSTERIKCHFKGCQHTFSTKTNLNQHVKAVHLEHRPFLCGFPGCDMRFAYKHVRDNHEKSGLHVYTPGDFVESDRQFRSRPRGGRKREFPTVEMLIRKRDNGGINSMEGVMNGNIVCSISKTFGICHLFCPLNSNRKQAYTQVSWSTHFFVWYGESNDVKECGVRRGKGKQKNSFIQAAWTRRSRGELEKKPNKKSWKQRTEMYMKPFLLNVFFSRKFIQAKVMHRGTSKVISVATTNAKDLRHSLPSLTDHNACRIVGKLIAERSKEADVYAISYEPRKDERIEGKLGIVIDTIKENGIIFV